MNRALLVVLLCAISAWAGPKKKKASAKPAPPSAEMAAASTAVTQALDGVQPAASACVVEVLGDDTAWKAQVKVKLVIDAQGHLLEVLITSTPENVSPAHGCIEKLVKGATWPVTHAPLVTAEREWTFEMQ